MTKDKLEVWYSDKFDDIYLIRRLWWETEFVETWISDGMWIYTIWPPPKSWLYIGEFE